MAKKKKRRAARAARKKDWKASFLPLLAAGSTVTDAAVQCGVDRATVYRHLQADPVFAESFADAEKQSADLLEQEARHRATHGVDEPVIYQGQLTFIGIDKNGKPCDPTSPLAVKNVPLTVRKPSDTLLIFLLKGRRPDVFGDKVRVDGDVNMRTPADGTTAANQLVAELRQRLGITDPEVA